MNNDCAITWEDLLFRDLLDLITVFSCESRYDTPLDAPGVVNRNFLDGQEITLSWKLQRYFSASLIIHAALNQPEHQYSDQVDEFRNPMKNEFKKKILKETRVWNDFAENSLRLLSI